MVAKSNIPKTSKFESCPCKSNIPKTAKFESCPYFIKLYIHGWGFFIPHSNYTFLLPKYSD
jgi:hypothetical protein